jgi:Fe2+ transport system protein B
MTTDADFQRLETKVDRLTDAVMRLVLIEERQSTQGERIGACETKIAVIESAQIKTDRILHMWINRGMGVWAAVGLLWLIFQFVFKR